MRSIVPKILIWLVGTVIFALVGCLVTGHVVATRFAGQNDFFGATQQLQVDAAAEMFERDGPTALRAYLDRLDQLFRAEHHLIDEQGHDVLDGRNLTEHTGRPQNGPKGHNWNEDLFARPMIFKRPSADGRYRLLVHLRPPFGPWQTLPYFLWVFLAILAIGYAMAIHFVRPLERLRNAVETFGRGDLDARADLNRGDEFGELGKAFDKMAQRIQALVIAERLLLQDISHELRSPLTRLRFALELARDSEDRETSVQRANKEVARLTELVEQLLQLTRAEGDITARNVADVALCGLVSDSLDDFQIEADAKGCVVTRRLEANPVVRGDYELIRRAVDNVLSNALRHAPPQSNVTVTLRSGGGMANLSIRDQGSGVPEDLLVEIFKPFRRVETDRDRDTGGLGLGLSIARRAVELHQGTITARNAGPGLEIMIQLPISNAS